MNTHSLLSRSKAWWAAGTILAAAGMWAGVAVAEDVVHPKVTVKVDEAPLPRSDIREGGSFAPIVKRVSPSVVKVLVTERAKTVQAPDMPQFFNDPMLRQFFGDQFGNQGNQNGRRTQRQPAQEGLGSGVIVSSDGYVLTNNHVVHDADSIKVTLSDGRELPAKVVGTDPQADLAVVKVDAHDLPAITFADSDKIEVGDRVLAVGNPFGIGQTVTSGMISALGRATLGLDYEDFIQTDAAINPGNSGGALIDTNGRLVGINTAILSRSGGFQGIGFAIPSNLARNVMEQLAAHGKVIRGFLGVSIQDVTPELAQEFKIDQHSGALIAEVTPNSPAAKAGLKSGDIITKIADKPVHDGRHLKLEVANLAPGTKVPAEVLRDGHTTKVTINIGDQPKNRAVASNDGDNNSSNRMSPADKDQGTLTGVEIADLDSQARREFDIPARVRGALITNVDPASAAAEAGLQPGDVILEINRHSIKSADEAVKLTESNDSKKTLLRVWSQRGSRYVVVDETNSSNGAPSQ
ncbi:MAG TPA: DegQ family serine endoprotease [Opitutaceae bacterium]|nr:DegQ family serine endoprotease [Opitutaceae bacterium]